MIKKAVLFGIILVILVNATIFLPLVQASALPSLNQDIVSELITLKSKKSQLGQELTSLNNRLSNIDSHLNELEKKIIDTEFNLNKETKILSARAKAMYKEERHNSSLMLILQSESVYDLIARFSFFGLIIKQDIKLIKEVKTDRAKLIKLKSDYIAKRQKIASLKDAKQRALTDAKMVKSKLEQKLKSANKKQVALADEGLVTAKFYDNYLSSKGSPMTGLGATLVAAGRQYSINPGLVVAISGVESSFGKHNANAFNAWGRKAKGGGGYQGFASWEAAVFNQTQYLRIKYFDLGLTTLYQIGSKYAPGNSTWPPKVQHFLDDIKNFK